MADVVELRKSLKQTIEEAGEDLLQKLQEVVSRESEPIFIIEDPELIAAIKEGETDIEAGRVSDWSDLKKKRKEWRKKYEA